MKFADLRNYLKPAVIVLVAATTIGALQPAHVAAAAETRDGPSPVGVKSAAGKVSKEQAVQNALAALPGTVGEVTIEKKRGRNVWVVEVVTEKTGDEKDVLVDMDSGKVIGIED